MKTSKPAGEHLHDGLHRLLGMPAHARPDELNAKAARGLRNRPLRNTPLRNTPLRNTPLRNTPLRNPDGYRERPPRLLAGCEVGIGRRFGRGQR
jgi:hypothetical protein